MPNRPLCEEYKARLNSLKPKFTQYSYRELDRVIRDAATALEAKEAVIVFRDREINASPDLMACLSSHSQQFIEANAVNPLVAIPPGPYCYRVIGINEQGHLKTRYCPHAHYANDDSGDAIASCDLLGSDDFDAEESLLWDSVKECGLNEILPEEVTYLRTISQ